MFGRTLACAVAGALLVVVCGVCAGAQAQELVDNPQYTSWAKHKPGTTVTIKMMTAASGQNVNMQLKQTLKEVTADTVTVEVVPSMDMGGTTQTMPAQTMQLKSKVSPEEAKFGQLPPGSKADVKDLGSESVTVAGQTYNCTVSEVTGESQGTKTKGKVWRSEDVPGQVVKMEMAFEGAQTGSTKMELVSVEKK
jgi:hypothetical protein